MNIPRGTMMWVESIRQKVFWKWLLMETNQKEEGVKSMAGSPNATLYGTLSEKRSTRPRE